MLLLPKFMNCCDSKWIRDICTSKIIDSESKNIDVLKSSDCTNVYYNVFLKATQNKH